MARSRPGGVTLVAILAWISGALNVIGGAVLLLTAPASAAPGAAVLGGIIGVVLGLATIFVAVGLWRGSNLARTIATVVFTLNLINGIVTIFTTAGNAWSGVVSALFALIGIVLLWTKAASAFFRR
ncbi:hypothetical protein ABC304_04500 [Microbacterium sp. 1P10UB]|uniref:hypothetical protein n=1 Tax=unclassified Microbacterium TaxID=2609290 RepID=UPI0039A03D5F